MAFEFIFDVLLGIFVLLLALLIKSHFDHMELIGALARLRAQGCQEKNER